MYVHVHLKVFKLFGRKKKLQIQNNVVDPLQYLCGPPRCRGPPVEDLCTETL